MKLSPVSKERPKKSGWYVATRSKLYTEFLHASIEECPSLVLPSRFVYYNAFLHLWYSVTQHYYWFEQEKEDPSSGHR